MTDALSHRGPDGHGYYFHENVGLGHRRLAIIDPSPAGHQPMAGEAGDVIVSQNGEIFNFQDLRIQLETAGHKFHSNSDTEVLVHGYEEWGSGVVGRLNGMFAFAILDLRRRELVLVRDRYGVKPLYWCVSGSSFLFSSEIKGLLAYPGMSASVDPSVLNEYFTFQNTFGEATLFAGVNLLPPGSVLTLGLAEGSTPTIRRYWDYEFADQPVQMSEREATEELTRLVRQAVTRQLVSDVPIGSYLSGGMDSGSITAVASSHLRRLRTFTCGFDVNSVSGLEVGFDEREAAEAVANELRTEHYEVVLHAGDMEEVLPELIWHLEELRVGQCYPNYYVARLAGKFVKVVLSGAGGDELFAGYPWRYYRGLEGGSSRDYLENYYQFWQRLVPDAEKGDLFDPVLLRGVTGPSPFERFSSVFNGYHGHAKDLESSITASLYFELKTFMHGLLVVEDKMSMAHGLETRVPFLDNDLVDFALAIPTRFKLRSLDKALSMDENLAGKRHLYRQQNADGKAILRSAMVDILPKGIGKRAKQGFSAPDASWFRGPSIDYINSLLRNPRALLYEFIQPAYVARILDEHMAGSVNHRLLIWSFLSFEWWCRIFLAGHRPKSGG